jgi:hypothetical protein
MPYPIFEIYEKPPFGPSFHANLYKKGDFFQSERSLNRSFLNIVSFLFLVNPGKFASQYRFKSPILTCRSGNVGIARN